MYWSEGILSGRENLLDVCIDRQLRMLIARYVWRAIILAWKKKREDCSVLFAFWAQHSYFWCFWGICKLASFPHWQNYEQCYHLFNEIFNADNISGSAGESITAFTLHLHFSHLKFSWSIPLTALWKFRIRRWLLWH